MPTPADQVPAGMSALAQRVRKLERELAELRAARRLENATVSAGGLVIRDAGRLYMATPSGTRMVDLGPIEADGWQNPDGSPQQATVIRRQDGSAAITTLSAGSGSNQSVGLWDADGNIVVGDDAGSGGLARPYLPVGMWPAYDAGWDYWPRTAGTTMVQLWSGTFYRQQPRLVVVAAASMDTSGATGQIQLTLGGVAQGSPQNVTFTVGTFVFGPLDLSSYDYMAQLSVAVTAKRVTGSGAIRASVTSAYTLQS